MRVIFRWNQPGDGVIRSAEHPGFAKFRIAIGGEDLHVLGQYLLITSGTFVILPPIPHAMERQRRPDVVIGKPRADGPAQWIALLPLPGRGGLGNRAGQRRGPFAPRRYRVPAEGRERSRREVSGRSPGRNLTPLLARDPSTPSTFAVTPRAGNPGEPKAEPRIDFRRSARRVSGNSERAGVEPLGSGSDEVGWSVGGVPFPGRGARSPDGRPRWAVSAEGGARYSSAQ